MIIVGKGDKGGQAWKTGLKPLPGIESFYRLNSDVSEGAGKGDKGG